MVVVEDNLSAFPLQILILKTLEYIFFKNPQKVGCDLRIGSDLTVDSCGVCGGDDSSCGGPDAAQYYYWTAAQSVECSRSCGGGVRRTVVSFRG